MGYLREQLTHVAIKPPMDFNVGPVATLLNLISVRRVHGQLLEKDIGTFAASKPDVTFAVRSWTRQSGAVES